MDVDHKESRALKNWCFWTPVLEETFESPLDCKEIKPVNFKGNQSWKFIGETDADHLMQTADSLEKIPMLGNLKAKGEEGGRRCDG